MARYPNDHMTLAQAQELGMSLNDWCAHEQREAELDAKELDRIGLIVYTLLAAIFACALVIIVLLGAPLL